MRIKNKDPITSMYYIVQKNYTHQDIPFIFHLPAIAEFIRWGIKFK